MFFKAVVQVVLRFGSESAERVAYCHLPVLQGGREESPTDGGRGDAGEFGELLKGLWKDT